jgi:hypothetical protein
MTFLPLQLPPGIVRGANPDDAPGRWFDGSLIRWREGVMEPVGGWSRITSAPLGSLCRRIHQWRANNGLALTLLGSDEHLYADNSGTFVDVAPSDYVDLNSAGAEAGYGAVTYGTGTYGTARTGSTTLTPNRPAWTFSNWGEDVISVASTDGRLFYYDATNVSTDVTTIGVYEISTISRTSDVTTIVTATPHNMANGETVAVSDVTDTSFNTTGATITVIDDTTFTYPNIGSDGSSTGGKVRDTTVPTNNRAVIVTPERHVVCLQPGGNPRRIAWSSREDFTDWDFTSTTNTAGFIEVQSETQLFALEAVREGTLIWSESRAYLMRYIGQPFIYGVDELGSTRLYAPNAFAQFDGRCVWMDSSGFMLYEGGSMKTLACPLSDYIFSSIDLLYGPRVSHAAVNGKFDEVWFFYPSQGQQECDRYVVWNWSENHWSMGTLSRTAAIGAGVSQYPVMTGPLKHVYQHEDGFTYDGFDCNNNVYIVSGTINLPGAENVLHITQMLPANGGDYDLTKYTLFTRMTPNGAERMFGPYYSRADGYVDTRAVGRDVRIRICANGAGDWSIGRIRMKIAAGGKR